MDLLTQLLESLGMIVKTQPIRGDNGKMSINLYATLKENSDQAGAPVFFCTHVDTVFHDRKIVVIEDKEAFYTNGETILGADPKMAITCMLECVALLREYKCPHGPIQFIFTSAEEVGCVGGSQLKEDWIIGHDGYVLDHIGDVGTIVNASYNHALVNVKIINKNGKGVNKKSEQMIQTLIDNRVYEQTIYETRSMQTNISRGYPVFEWNANLYCVSKEALQTERQQIVDWKNSYQTTYTNVSELHIHPSISGYDQHVNQFVVLAAQRAMSSINIPYSFVKSRYITDTNFIHAIGKNVINLGVGYEHIHTNEETIQKQSFTKLTKALLGIVEQFYNKREG